MRKIFLLSVFIVTTIFAAGHPASAVELKFDMKEKMLTVTAKHEVGDLSKHYIENMEILLNGKKAVTQIFMSQFDGKEQKAVYKIVDAQKGSEITVNAECNKGGKKENKIKVE